eukprot:2681619-Alexandrium_andersonii.AAC.1
MEMLCKLLAVRTDGLTMDQMRQRVRPALENPEVVLRAFTVGKHREAEQGQPATGASASRDALSSATASAVGGAPSTPITPDLQAMITAAVECSVRTALTMQAQLHSQQSQQPLSPEEEEHRRRKAR